MSFIINPYRFAAFQPTDIAGLTLWLDAAEGLFQSSGGSAATSDGDPVGEWQDQSGNGNHFAQATPAKKPTLKLSIIGGKPVVRFDGDDLLVANNFSSALEGTVVAVAQRTGTGQHAVWASEDEAVQGAFRIDGWIKAGGTTDKWGLDQKNNDTTDAIQASVLTISTFYLLVWRSDGTAYTVRLNGADDSFSVVNGSNNGDWLGDTSNRDNFTIGARKTAVEANYLEGDIAEFLIYDSDLTGTDLTDLESYLNDKYAIF